VPRSKNGAILPLPQYAFMAWCSVKRKAQGQLYLSTLEKWGKNVRTEFIWLRIRASDGFS